MLRILDLSTMSPKDRAALMARAGTPFEKLLPDVRAICRGVRERGDAAVREYTKQFDGVSLPSPEVPPEEIASADAKVPKGVLVALQAARENIQRYHQRDVPKGFEFQSLPGVILGKI